MNLIKTLLATLAFGTVALSSMAQERPIGYWRAHMPYNSAVSLASNGKEIFVATQKAFYIYNIGTKESESFSKVEGMSDVGMSWIGYDTYTSTAILAYANSNIDLYKDGSFYNLPEIKNKTVSGSKKVNRIYTEPGLAFLSTDQGIVVIDLEKREVKETYSFYLNNQILPITDFTATGSFYYAASTKGFYKANKNAVNLQSFAAWTKIDTGRSFVGAAIYKDKVFVTGADSLFVVQNDTLKFIYRSDTNTRHIDGGVDGLFITENYKKTFNGMVRKMDENFQFIDSFKTPGLCTHVLQTDTNNVWLADEFSGMKIRELRGDPYGILLPEGPSHYANFDIYANNGEIWVAHGGYNDLMDISNSSAGFSSFKNEKWTQFRTYESPVIGNDKFDFIRIIKGNDGNVYVGSAQDGLLILKPDGTTENYAKNSFIDSSAMSGSWHWVNGFAFDDDNNLWMTVHGGKRELVVRTKTGSYYQMAVPIPRGPIPNAAGQIIIDDNGQKWYTTTGSTGGVIVYDDNHTPENAADDKYRALLAGKGLGGLPDNETYSIAKDKNGAIWIGTKNGIGIVNCPGQVMTGGCEAEVRVVQYDDFAGYLFESQQVKAIAVDGANRKWIGTNNGVWLVSPEGDKVVNRFTAANSPLPSDLVQKIEIDPVTGDVYIGTEDGLVSYRGTATEGGEENAEVKAFPNPVPSGYSGNIAIKGLVENADVRITDISGQLVYRTKAFGGQAVWNGIDYTGRRPQSGVYMVFITNKDGSQTHVGKLVFME